MPIEPGFRFSANNLQEYTYCPRRFELKYLLKQSYPAIISQPVLEMEHRMEMGQCFHSLVNQFLSGVDADLIDRSIPGEPLKTWFQNFLDFFRQFSRFKNLSEHTFFIPFEGFQCIAVFDLIIFKENNEILIVDWKTTLRDPDRARYEIRMQTTLYPFLLYECMCDMESMKNLQPDNISMQYWFPANPGVEIIFPYSHEKRTQNREKLIKLIQAINALDLGKFEKTNFTNRCEYCQYRSLCERGEQAGGFSSAEEAFDLEDLIQSIAIESVTEIQY